MTIQPLSSRPREISVTEAIEPAYERVKRMLFQPFDFSKWIVIGFCAWLAGLGESGGGGFNGFGNFGNGQGGQAGEKIRQSYAQARDYVLANLDWIIPLAVFLVLLLLAIWLLVIWLSSRGKFMFLHCVAWDKAEVEEPWRQYAAEANSLLRFRICLALLSMGLCLPPVGLAAMCIIKMVQQGEPNIAGVMLAAASVLVIVILAIVFAIIRKFTMDFVVPFMFLRRTSCLAAWGEFRKLLARNPGQFTVYILFQIVLAVAVGAIVMAAFLVTCCLACCLAMLPFVGTLLLLPVLVFMRAYSLYYLAQYGAQYDVFAPPAAPSEPTASEPIQPLTPAAG